MEVSLHSLPLLPPCKPFSALFCLFFRKERKSSCICWNMSWDGSQLFFWALTRLWTSHHSLAWQSISWARVTGYKGRGAAGTLLSWPDLNRGIKSTAHMPSSLFRETDMVTAVVTLRKIALNSQICFKKKLPLPLFLTGNQLKVEMGRLCSCLYPGSLEISDFNLSSSPLHHVMQHLLFYNSLHLIFYIKQFILTGKYSEDVGLSQCRVGVGSPS